MAIINRNANKPLTAFGLLGKNIYRAMVATFATFPIIFISLAISTNPTFPIIVIIAWVYYCFRLKQLNTKYGEFGYPQQIAQKKLPKVLHGRRLNTIIKHEK